MKEPKSLSQVTSVSKNIIQKASDNLKHQINLNVTDNPRWPLPNNTNEVYVDILNIDNNHFLSYEQQNAYLADFKFYSYYSVNNHSIYIMTDNYLLLKAIADGRTKKDPVSYQEALSVAEYLTEKTGKKFLAGKYEDSQSYQVDFMSSNPETSLSTAKYVEKILKDNNLGAIAAYNSSFNTKNSNPNDYTISHTLLIEYINDYIIEKTLFPVMVCISQALRMPVDISFASFKDLPPEILLHILIYFLPAPLLSEENKHVQVNALWKNYQKQNSQMQNSQISHFSIFNQKAKPAALINSIFNNVTYNDVINWNISEIIANINFKLGNNNLNDENFVLSAKQILGKLVCLMVEKGMLTMQQARNSQNIAEIEFSDNIIDRKIIIKFKDVYYTQQFFNALKNKGYQNITSEIFLTGVSNVAQNNTKIQLTNSKSSESQKPISGYVTISDIEVQKFLETQCQCPDEFVKQLFKNLQYEYQYKYTESNRNENCLVM